MKGMEIAEDFFFNWGKPYLQTEFPELAQRVAVGLLEGSDAIGADDEISRDHNWGPQFGLFLSENDFQTFGQDLSEKMNTDAPSKWKDYHVAGAGDENVHVRSIPQIIHESTGLVEPPKKDRDWGGIVKKREVGGSVEAYESSLYFLRHGVIWFDGSGELTEWREALVQYPEKVLYARLGEECFRIWQYGEYNFISRLAKRKDPLAISMSLGKFTEGVMRIMLLMERDYTPYWKWLAHVFRKIDAALPYIPLMESLLAANDTSEQSEIMTQICGKVHQDLLEREFINDQDGNKYLSPLLNAHNELMSKADWMPILN